MEETYKCDICGKEFDDIYFGDWVTYCKGCEKEAKKKDWEMTYENEVKPSMESGDFSMLSGEVAESMMMNM